MSRTFIVVSDSVGVVGAFNDKDEAREKLKPYLGIPFMYLEWPYIETKDETDIEMETKDDETSTETKQEAEVVWAVPYKNNVIACASNDKSVVEHTQQILMRLDLVHTDDVVFWEMILGEIIHTSKMRLDHIMNSMKAAPARPEDDKVVDDFLKSQQEDQTGLNQDQTGLNQDQTGLNQDQFVECEKIDILKGVIPFEF